METNKDASKEFYTLLLQICNRAKTIGFLRDDLFMNAMMDLESAYLHFNLDLPKLLNCNIDDFIHDYCGIVANIVRDEFPSTNFGDFKPICL